MTIIGAKISGRGFPFTSVEVTRYYIQKYKKSLTEVSKLELNLINEDLAPIS